MTAKRRPRAISAIPTPIPAPIGLAAASSGDAARPCRRASCAAKLAACLAAAALLILLAGCSPSPGLGPTDAKEATPPSEAAAEPEPTATETPAEPTPTRAPDGLATPRTAGVLHVSQGHLVDAAGNPVQLRGVSTHGLAWFPQYVNAPLFSELRSQWGANVVRLALYTAEYNGFCTGGNQAELEAALVEGVNLATEADLYAVIDWHMLSDGNPNQYLDQAKAFFQTMSAQFADQNNVIYEICNEPNGGTTWADVKSYAEAVIPVIRANAPNAIVVVGTPEWSQRIDQAAADPLAFENVMYGLHFYAATHQQDLRDRLAQAAQGGLPVFVTEFGICDASGNGAVDVASADAWVALMDSYDISYICWNLSNKNESSALIAPDNPKTSGFSTDDLSAEGLWLWNVLQGHRTD